MIKKASRLNTLNSNKYKSANAGNTSIADVPDSPTSVSATDVGTARAFNNGAATITFTPAATGGVPVSFTVTSTPGSFTATGASSPLSITGLSSGTSYTFSVTATNTTATSPSSTASSPITATTVPGTPTIGSASGGTGGAVSVTFTAPINSGGSAITSYTVLSSSGVSSSGSASPISITETTSGTYTYTVTATNINGTSTASAASNSLVVTAVVTDTFNRTTTGSLGTSSSGTSWVAITGTWYANGSQAQDTADTASSYPIAAVLLSNSPTVSAQVSEGTGVAFWVAGTGAWYAAISYNLQSPYSCGCGTCYNSCASCANCGCAAYNSCATVNCGCAAYGSCSSGYLYNGACYSGPVGTGYIVGAPPCLSYNTCVDAACGCATCASCVNTSCSTYSCGCSTCYNNYYYLRSVKSVSGTVSTLFSDVALSAAAAAIKVVANSGTGNVSIYAYSDAGMTTQVGTTSGTPTSPVMGSYVGIIKGPAGVTQGTTVDNFSAHN